MLKELGNPDTFKTIYLGALLEDRELKYVFVLFGKFCNSFVASRDLARVVKGCGLPAKCCEDVKE